MTAAVIVFGGMVHLWLLWRIARAQERMQTVTEGWWETATSHKEEDR